MIINVLSSILTNVAKNMGYEETLKVIKSNRPDLCDYQSNDIFKIAKKEGKSPIEVGKEVELKINGIKNFNDYFDVCVIRT